MGADSQRFPNAVGPSIALGVAFGVTLGAIAHGMSLSVIWIALGPVAGVLAGIGSAVVSAKG